jgi:hypothetical protein
LVFINFPLWVRCLEHIHFIQFGNASGTYSI